MRKNSQDRNENINNYEQFFKMGLENLQKKKYEKAISKFDKILNNQIQPLMTQAYNNKGLALQELNQVEAAINCYDAAIKVDKGYDISYYNKGNALIKISQYEQAIENFNQAIENNNQNFKALNNKGYALEKLSKFKDSAKSYLEALKLNNMYILAYDNFFRSMSQDKNQLFAEFSVDLKSLFQTLTTSMEGFQ